MPKGIAHLLKLVEDHHGGVLLELPGLVKDLLDVGLAARRGDDLPGDLAEPLKALLAHLGREDGHAVTGQQLGVEGAAAAVVAGGGPDGVMAGGVKLPGHQAGSQTAKGGAHFMASGGEPLAGHGQNAAGDPGQGGGQLHIVGHSLIAAAEFLGFVLPGDAEEVQRIDVPQSHVFQLVPDGAGNGFRLLHLGDGGNDDIIFAGLFDVSVQTLSADGKVDHIPCPP